MSAQKGWLILLIGTFVVTIIKGCFVWAIERDRDNSGGAPTADFVLFWPALLAWFATEVAESRGYHPFAGWGFVLWIGVPALYGGVYWLLLPKAPK